ncbi:MAG: hypothetical protein IJ068_02885 [Bacilli bacterium]|nr:hypothetical protein [Bacilli bacterium]
MIIVIFLILLSFSLYLYMAKDIRIENSLPYTFISVILVLFLGGMVKLLKLSVYLIAILGIICFIISICKFIKCKNKKDKLKELVSPGFVFFIFVSLFVMYYHKGRMLTKWDEFSHWGDVVKVMYTINDFSTSKESLSAFQSYLPGMSLFQYFWQVLLGEFNEGVLFSSYQILAFSMFLPFMTKITWKNIVKYILSIALIGLSFLVFFNMYYKTIYIDCFLGLLFAFNLANIYINRDNYDKKNIIKLSLSPFLLTLTKDVGVLLAFLCIFIAFVNFIIKNIKNKQFEIKDYLPILIFLIVIFGTYFIWQLKIKISGASQAWDNPLDINFIINSLLGKGDIYGVTVRDNFLDKLWHFKILGGYLELNVISAILINLMLYYIIYINSDLKYKLNNLSVLGISFISFFVYMFMLLVLYLWKFSEYEAVRLASFERYTGTYLQGLLFFMVFIVIYNDFKKVKNKNRIKMDFFAVLLFVILSVNTDTFKSYCKRGIKDTVDVRESYNLSSNIIKSKLGKERKRLYFISQGSTGYDYWVLKFSARENIKGINTGFSWSLGTKYYDGDIWTKEISSDEWYQELDQYYDYVYLYRIDEQFISEFGDLFENTNDIKNDNLYLIDKENKKLVIV